MLDSEPSNYEPAFPQEKEEDEDLGRIGSPPDSVRERSNQESKLSDPPPPPPPPRADTWTEEIIETVPEEVREEEDYNAEVEESKREPIRVREAEASLKDSSFTTKGISSILSKSVRNFDEEWTYEHGRTKQKETQEECI